MEYKEYFECACRDSRHLTCFFVDDGDIDGMDPWLIINTQASKPKFLKRLYRGIRYIFGGSGDLFWDETIIYPEDKERLLNIINKLPDDSSL